MEPLHAPWRLPTFGDPNQPPDRPSFFKRIAESNDDLANYVIVRDRTCYAVLNCYPYNGGHLMVVPYKASPDLNGLTEGELGDLMKLTRRCQNALTRVMNPDGFNIGINLGTAAGAGIIDHVHIHIVPRWNVTPILCRSSRAQLCCPRRWPRWRKDCAPRWPDNGPSPCHRNTSLRKRASGAAIVQQRTAQSPGTGRRAFRQSRRARKTGSNSTAQPKPLSVPADVSIAGKLGAKRRHGAQS